MAIPKNAHVSTHPCLQAKLSQLRSASTGSKDAQTLVHELALMVGYEALGAALKTQQDGTVRTFVTITHHHTSQITFPPTCIVPHPFALRYYNNAKQNKRHHEQCYDP